MAFLAALLVSFGLARAPLARAPIPKAPPRIAVIGAGLSGMSAAYRLSKAGLKPVVFEAADRIGGRTRSLPDPQTGLVLEAGAELVNSDHHALIGLAGEVGVSLARRHPGDLPQTFFYEGEAVPLKDFYDRLFREAGPQLERIQADIKRIEKVGRRARKAYDKLSIGEYLDRIQAPASLRALARSALDSEYGDDHRRLTALIFLEALSVDSAAKRLEVFPGYDEAFRITGGAQSLAEAAARASGAELRANHRLTKIVSRDGKTFELEFASPEGVRRASVDGLVMAVPLPALASIEIQAPGWTPELRADLEGRRYGANAKLLMLFSKRLWKERGHSGAGFSDLGLSFWDSSEGQDAAAGMLTAFSRHRPTHAAVDAVALGFLRQLEALFPGISETFLGHRFFPWSHSYPGADHPGERTSKRYSGKPLGRLVWANDAFAPPQNQGIMNTAVEAGLRAGEELARRLGF